MRIRTGFVSNSSSASFVLQKKNLTTFQIDAIYNHIAHATKHQIKCGKVEGYKYNDYDRWTISETADFIKGWTSMDNFYFDKFLIGLGIPEDQFSYYPDEF